MADKLPPMNLPGPAVPYMRALEKKLMDVANEQVRTSQNLTNIRSNAKQGGAAFDLAMTRLNNLDRTVTQIPLSPANVQGEQHWTWDALKHASARLEVSWDAVTKSGDGQDMTVPTYEVWLREANQNVTQRAVAVGELFADIVLPKINTGYYVSVNGVSANGTAGGMSNEVYVAPPGALAPLTPPTAPGLASNFGVIVVAWDGLLTGPDPVPDHFAYIRIFMRTPGEAWHPVGPTLTTAGSVTIAGEPVDSTREFTFLPYDRMGNTGDISEIRSIVVTGVDLGTLGTDLEQLESDLAANAQAISGAQQAIASGGNLAADGLFADTSKQSWTGSGVVEEVANEPNRLKIITAASGNNDQSNTNVFQVTPGEKVYVEMEVMGAAGNVGGGGPNLHLMVTRSVGGPSWPGFEVTRASVQGAWTKISGVITIPADALTAKVEPAISYSADAVGNIYYIRRVVARRMTSTALIESGAVTSDTLAPSAVLTQHVMPGAITATQIGAGSIISQNIGAGQILALNIGAGQIVGQHIAADTIEANNIKVGAIQVSHLSPSVGQSIDISANNSVNILVGSINETASDLSNVNSTVEEMSTYYQFGPDGATISAPDSVFAVAITNDSIDMLEQGVTVSSWTAGQMHVNSFVGNEVILGNHKLEKYGNGTVVRAI